MKEKTFTFTEIHQVPEVGDLVTPCSPISCVLPPGVYEVADVEEPAYPGDVVTTFVRGFDRGISRGFRLATEEEIEAYRVFAELLERKGLCHEKED